MTARPWTAAARPGGVGKRAYRVCANTWCRAWYFGPPAVCRECKRLARDARTVTVRRIVEAAAWAVVLVLMSFEFN